MFNALLIAATLYTSQFNYMAHGPVFPTDIESNFTGNVEVSFEDPNTSMYFSINSNNFEYDDGIRPGVVVSVSFLFTNGILEELDYDVRLDGVCQFAMHNHCVFDDVIVTIDNLFTGEIVRIPTVFSTDFVPSFGSIDLASHTTNHWGYVWIYPSLRGEHLIGAYSNNNIVDTNLNGVVDSNDLDTYINMWNMGLGHADLNLDGVYDTTDLFDYLNRYFN